MSIGRSVLIATLSMIPAGLIVGCSGRPSGAPDIPVPEIGKAKAAMVASLDAWKAGRREGGTIGAKPQIVMVDSLRAERALVGYEVIGPLSVVDRARPFAVRLNLDGPRETITTRYVVLGDDPLYVFHQEDFDLMIHWEHKMPPIDPNTNPPVDASPTRSPAS